MSHFSPRRLPVLSTFLALVASYALVYLYEKSLLWLIKQIRDQHLFGPYWQVDLMSSIAPLVVLVVIAALAWLGLYYFPPSRISAILYILLGIFTIGLHYYHYLSFISSDIFFPMWLKPQTWLGQIRFSFMEFGAGAYASTIQYLATGTILIGIAILWKGKMKEQETPQEA